MPFHLRKSIDDFGTPCNERTQLRESDSSHQEFCVEFKAEMPKPSRHNFKNRYTGGRSEK